MMNWNGVERRQREIAARRLGTGIVALMAVLLGLNFYGTFIYNPAEREHQLEAVRAGQIQNCKVVGDPLRSAVITDQRQDIMDIREEIEQSKNLPPEFFPGIPPEEFDRLVRLGRQRDRATIAADEQVVKDLSDVPPCEERYPPVSELEDLAP